MYYKRSAHRLVHSIAVRQRGGAQVGSWQMPSTMSKGEGIEAAKHVAALLGEGRYPEADTSQLLSMKLEAWQG